MDHVQLLYCLNCFHLFCRSLRWSPSINKNRIHYIKQLRETPNYLVLQISKKSSHYWNRKLKPSVDFTKEIRLTTNHFLHQYCKGIGYTGPAAKYRKRLWQCKWPNREWPNSVNSEKINRKATSYIKSFGIGYPWLAIRAVYSIRFTSPTSAAFITSSPPSRIDVPARRDSAKGGNEDQENTLKEKTLY